MSSQFLKKELAQKFLERVVLMDWLPNNIGSRLMKLQAILKDPSKGENAFLTAREIQGIRETYKKGGVKAWYIQEEFSDIAEQAIIQAVLQREMSVPAIDQIIEQADEITERFSEKIHLLYERLAEGEPSATLQEELLELISEVATAVPKELRENFHETDDRIEHDMHPGMVA